MQQNSILTGRGLYESIHNHRTLCLAEFVKKSKVAFVDGELFGHLFTEPEIDAFISCSHVLNKRAAKSFWAEHSRAFGATGRKILQIHLVDAFIDLAAGVKK